MANQRRLEEVILRLYDVEGLKFGSFTMRTGEVTPVYIDMRVIWSYPDIVRGVCELLWEEAKHQNLEFDLMCGLPYQGIPLASILSEKHNIPMVLKRKQKKTYGTCLTVEGHFKEEDRILLIDDVLMTGGTYVDDIPFFRENKLNVVGGLLFFDRDQGAVDRIKHICNVPIYSCVTISEAFKILVKAGKVTQATADNVMEYIRSNQFNTPEYGVKHD